MSSSNNATFPRAPVRRFVDANNFPDYGLSSFPLFSLGPVPKSTLEEISRTINEQTRDMLGFDVREYEELGLVIDIPENWDLSGKTVEEAVQDFFALMESDERLPSGDPKWYPVSFVGVLQKDWHNKGLVMAYLEDDKERGYLELKSCVVGSDRLGDSLISLRQGDNYFDDEVQYIEDSGERP